MRERVDLKSPVRENRMPGSARGAGRKASPYRDRRCGPRNDPPPFLSLRTERKQISGSQAEYHVIRVLNPSAALLPDAVRL